MKGGCDIFRKIAAQGEAEAQKTMLEIEVLAHIIADKMEHIHGLPCRVQIDHELAFIVVR